MLSPAPVSFRFPAGRTNGPLQDPAPSDRDAGRKSARSARPSAARLAAPDRSPGRCRGRFDVFGSGPTLRPRAKHAGSQACKAGRGSASPLRAAAVSDMPARGRQPFTRLQPIDAFFDVRPNLAHRVNTTLRIPPYSGAHVMVGVRPPIVDAATIRRHGCTMPKRLEIWPTAGSASERARPPPRPCAGHRPVPASDRVSTISASLPGSSCSGNRRAGPRAWAVPDGNPGSRGSPLSAGASSSPRIRPLRRSPACSCSGRDW